MDAVSNPLVLIANCAQLQPQSIIKDILKTTELPESKSLVEDIRGYPWKIDTRYYTSEVLLAASYSRTIGNEDFAAKVEAFIVHFDTTKSESFESVKQWLPFVTELGPEIRILLCDTCSDGDAVSRLVAWQWCLDNSFELVELQPTDTDADSHDVEDDFEDVAGIERVIQALHNHTWSNLVMKDKPSFRSQYMEDMMKEHAEEQTSETENKPEQSESIHNKDTKSLTNKDSQQSSHESADSSKTDVTNDSVTDTRTSALSSNGEKEHTTSSTSESSKSRDVKDDTDLKDTAAAKNKDTVIDSLMDEDRLNMLGGQVDAEDDEESFEKLFENFRLMKEKAEVLPLEQRKKYAEQVAIQFWKAMGGEDDEIEGLS